MTLAVNIAQSGSNNQTMRNRIINGAMVIDQRNNGASVSVTSDPGPYTLDRWVAFKNVVNNYTVQRVTDAPAGFINSSSITMGTGVTITSNAYAGFSQLVEGFNIADFAWGTANAQPVTLSFWAKSSLTGTFGVTFRNGASNMSYPATYTINAANTWEYKTITIPGAPSGTWATNNTIGVSVIFDLGVGTDYAAAPGSWVSGPNVFGVTGTVKLAATTGATLYITGVQLEEGTAASPFENRLITTELQLCQRYYWKSQASSAANGNFGMGIANTSTNVDRVIFPLPVTMRATPTVSYSNLRAYDGQNATPITAIPTNFSTPSIGSCSFTASLLTLYRATMIIDNGGTTDFVAFTAEL